MLTWARIVEETSSALNQDCGKHWLGEDCKGLADSLLSYHQITSEWKLFLREKTNFVNSADEMKADTVSAKPDIKIKIEMPSWDEKESLIIFHDEFKRDWGTVKLRNLFILFTGINARLEPMQMRNTGAEELKERLWTRLLRLRHR